MDAAGTIPCSFCRNYSATTTATQTMTATATCGTAPSSSPTSTSWPCTSCPSCVRLYEGLTTTVGIIPSSSNVVKSQQATPSQLSTKTQTTSETQILSSWSHLVRRRWLRQWRIWLDRLDSGSNVSRLVSKMSAAQTSFSQSLSTSFLLVVLVIVFTATSVDACSSRSTPKPRPPSQGTMRPNITFQTYACPPAYAAWYCLNGATCFTVKIADSILYNCECADGYMGQRCEFKDLDGSYLPARERLMMGQSASIGQAFLAVLLIVMAAIVASVIFTLRRTRSKIRRKQETGFDDGIDFVYGASPSVLPHYSSSGNSNGGAVSEAIGLSTFGHHPATLAQTTIGNHAAGVANADAVADTSVLGQSISYSLSRQNVQRQTSVSYARDDYYINGSRNTNRYYSNRIPQVSFRAGDHFT